MGNWAELSWRPEVTAFASSILTILSLQTQYLNAWSPRVPERVVTEYRNCAKGRSYRLRVVTPRNYWAVDRYRLPKQQQDSSMS
jgi:hypothetical protein